MVHMDFQDLLQVVSCGMIDKYSGHVVLHLYQVSILIQYTVRNHNPSYCIVYTSVGQHFYCNIHMASLVATESDKLYICKSSDVFSSCPYSVEWMCISLNQIRM